MVRLFARRKSTAPYRHVRDTPSWPGAYLFTLRSVPRHYEVIRETIDSTGDARVWFGEALAYIHGKGVSLFRVEATGFTWLPELYGRWHAIEREEAFPFEIDLYVNNVQWAANLRNRPPEEIEAIIRDNAPRYDPAARRIP
ncbi:MAG TPA: hypothetical protein VFN57_06535 [Thermomicrobiaceae bacterium]|nr:hypothetical protein [Thermomicrobiaceae bacterium]